MLHRIPSILLLAPALFLAACQNTTRAVSTNPVDAATTVRDQGYSLLYATISDESDVDKVLIIKKPVAPVADLIRSIGQFARDTKSTLQALAKEDPSIILDHQGLPEVETKTRDAISSATSKQIVFHSGKEFEFRILLTQHEALNYVTHLAATLADQESRENRKRYLSQLSKQSDALHEQVLGLLKTSYVGPSK